MWQVRQWIPGKLTMETMVRYTNVNSNPPAPSVSFVVPASGPSRTATSAPASGGRTVSLTESRMWLCVEGCRGEDTPGFTLGGVGDVSR